MSPCVSFQVKGVIETFSAEGTKISFYIAVTLHVSVQKALKCESFLADSTLKFGGIFITAGWRKLVRFWSHGGIKCQRIFDAMSTIYKF